MSLFHRIRTPFGETDEAEPFAYEPSARAVGELLRERREDYRLDLDTVGTALCIKPGYLAALEQGRTQDLPGPTYAIGFIRAYANYLGFDGEEILESYKAESAGVNARPDLALPVPLGERSVPGGPILLVAAILALCGYGTWYYLSTGERSRPARVEAVPAEVQREAAQPVQARPAAAPAAPNAVTGAKLASGLTQTDSPSPAPAMPGEQAAGAAAPAGSGPPGVIAAAGVNIKALKDCWIQVRAADDSIVFSRVLRSGETYHVPRSGLVLRTGNAGALAIAVDGKAAPSIGAVGTLRRTVALDPEALLAGTAVHG